MNETQAADAIAERDGFIEQIQLLGYEVWAFGFDDAKRWFVSIDLPLRGDSLTLTGAAEAEKFLDEVAAGQEFV